jgi:hypothetical protein
LCKAISYLQKLDFIVILTVDTHGREPVGIYLDEVPFKIVSDFETNDDPLSFSTTRRCGVRFGKFRRKQVSQFEYFIQNHTIVEMQVNLASGKPSENRIHCGVATAHQGPLPPIPSPTGTIS